MNSVCHECGHGVPQAARFCPQCGASSEPDDSQGWHGLEAQAHKAYKEGQLGEAGRLFAQLARHSGKAAVAGTFGLGVVLYKQGRLTEAAAKFAETRRLDPGHIEALFYLGAVAEREERTPEAVSIYKRVLAKEPAHKIARERLAYLDGSAATVTRLEPTTRPSAEPPGLASTTTGTVETDLTVPQTTEQLRTYAKKLREKKQEQFKIEHWYQYPVFVRVFIILFGLIMIAFWIAFAGNIFLPRGTIAGIGAAPKSWCMARYETWKSNPRFFGESTLVSLRESGCERYGIPPRRK